jgi:hypothetical protein
MKTKLLKLVWRRAKFRAHITSLTAECIGSWRRITGVSIGYGIAKEKPLYEGIWHPQLDEDAFDRKVRQRYWELNKKSYRMNYGKRN